MLGWLIHRKSTGNPQVPHRVKAALDIVTQITADLEVVRHRLSRLEIAHKELQDAHESLDGQLAKLRGQVHGARGGRPPKNAGVDSIPVGDKEALREYVGLRAGRRFTHEE